MKAIPVENLEVGGHNAPVTKVPIGADFSSAPLELGATRLKGAVDGLDAMDALLVRKESETLIVSLHGAYNPPILSRPRFERLRSLLPYDVSSLYFGDPTLVLDDRMLLGWYTGWAGFDGHAAIARWTSSIARSIGASRIIFSGASGGGFAALQVARFVPGSIAVVFNPQVDIPSYRVNGSLAVQRFYVQSAWPELYQAATVSGEFDPHSWAQPVLSRVSAVHNYGRAVPNFVTYIQNRNENHYADHYVPFKEAIESSPNRDRVNVVLYEGTGMHNPPPKDVYEDAIERAISDERWER